MNNHNNTIYQNIDITTKAVLKGNLRCILSLLEKAMATHSITLAWKTPRTEEPDGLLSMRSHRVGHDWSDLAAAAAAIPIRKQGF